MAYGISGTVNEDCTLYVYDKIGGKLLKSKSLSAGNYSEYLASEEQDVTVVAIPTNQASYSKVFNGVVTKTGITFDSNLWFNLGSQTPPGRHDHKAVVYEDKMYVVGGHLSSAPQLWEYNITDMVWEQKTSANTNRTLFVSVEYNGKIYLCLGRASSALSSVSVYDIASNSWSNGTSAQTSLQECAGCVYNGVIYLHGGRDTTSTYRNYLIAYDIDSNVWSWKTAGATARIGHTMIPYNGKLYIFGGVNGSTLYNDVWEYNLTTNIWTQKTSGATIRKYHTAIEYGGKMYIFGGTTELGYNTASLWEYDTQNNTWTQKEYGPSDRSQHSAVEYNGKMYTYGGYSALNTLFEYDI